MYAVHAFLGIDEESQQTIEATTECESVGAIALAIQAVVKSNPDFKAISIVHIEDLPALMEGAQTIPGDGKL